MVNLIPNVVKTWDDWNIRLIVLLSLGFQIFLILFSPLRKRICNGILTLFLWSTYQLADHAANFCIGLIVHRCNRVAVEDEILAFWGPFLLLHLGGQDAITAFSLEDNELWLRHLLSFVFQLGLTVYIFRLTTPGNTLWWPTILVLFAGSIKYIERTRSLYLASMDTFRKSVMDLNQPGDARHGDQVSENDDQETEDDRHGNHVSENDDQETEVDQVELVVDQETEDDHVELVVDQETGNDQEPAVDYVELVRKGYEYFKKYEGFVAEKTYSLVERNETRQYFLRRTAEDALTIIEVELNFMYEYFFTKASVLRTKVGCVFRFASFSLILAALLIFVFNKKHGFSELDVIVTYVLLLGAAGLEFVAFLGFILSDWAAINGGNVLIEHFLMLKKPKWSNHEEGSDVRFVKFSTKPLFRRWSGTIPGHNLITYWLVQYLDDQNVSWPDRKSLPVVLNVLMIPKSILYRVFGYFGAKELLEKWRFMTNNPFLKEFWEFIFSELQKKSRDAEDPETARTLCESRGVWSIQKGEWHIVDKHILMRYINSNEFALDETLIMWHIATSICFYHLPVDHVDACYPHRYYSKVLSDYMLYLLAMEPAIMSTVAGIGQQKILEIISSVAKISNQAIRVVGEGDDVRLERVDYANEYDICEGLLLQAPITDARGHRKLSKMRKAVQLARILDSFEQNKRWKIVARVWVEMLSYVAINCRPDVLVAQLSRGGQFISFVWLLMLHFGLGTRQYKKALEDEDEDENDDGLL